jgi:acyl-coenzyme A synthetase/AMP-(fatty) acid ligase
MERRDANLVLTVAGESALGELSARWTAERLAPFRIRAGPVAFACRTAEEGLGVAAGLATTGIDGLILPRDRLVDEVRTVLAQEGFAIDPGAGETVVEPAVSVPAVPGRISLLTSGTTGVPKVIHHRWTTLFTQKRVDQAPPNRWLLTYQVGTYAWFQMATLALFVPRQDVVVGDAPAPGDLLALAARRGATAISSTPTFWRYALLQSDPAVLASVPLRQITLGGEPVDQAILDQLRVRFPSARITHIYASSEVGAAIVVHDGREGFPAAWLERAGADRERHRIALRIQDGTLWVRSRHASLDHRGWVDTGDSVERQGDRVVVVGRRDASFINVGGMKLSSYAVERALLEHPRVAWCRARARPSPLVGSLVAADIVLRDVAESALEAETELTRHARARLPEHAVPRLWRFLDTIPVTAAHKAEVG